MKCKTCGATARSLAAMAAHYRKKHPSKMKKKRVSENYMRKIKSKPMIKYCSKCGQAL